MSDQTAFLLLALFLALLAAIIAGAIASFAYLLARAPFWPSYRSALKSSCLFCGLFFLVVIGLRQFVPQKAAQPASVVAPQAPPPAVH